MTLLVPDRRSIDLLSQPRAAVEEAWMDVRVLSLETRRDLGKALQDKHRGRDPWPRIYDADRRLIRLEQYARQRAAETAGITYISPGQTVLPLTDGCLAGDDRGA